MSSTRKVKEFEKAKEVWDDIVSEKEVIEKFNISARTLRYMRERGTIKNFRYVLPSSTGNAERPGKRPVYSKTELTQLFSPTI